MTDWEKLKPLQLKGYQEAQVRTQPLMYVNFHDFV